MSDVLHDYREAAAEHGRATQVGDPERANSAYRRLMAALTRLIAAKQDDLLFALYEDPDEWVQLWAAAHTLELDESRAMAKLRSLQDAKIPILSMNAKFTIREWVRGRLRVGR